MFTIFDAFELAVALGFLFVGGQTGFQHFGILGALVGAVLGGVVGYQIGRIAIVILKWLVVLYLRRMTTEELRAELRRPEREVNHHAFAELVRRGEDISQDLEVVLPMLVAGYNVKRIYGIKILRRFFPDLAEKLPEYDPLDSLDTCKKKVLEAGLMEGSAGLDDNNLINAERGA